MTNPTAATQFGGTRPPPLVIRVPPPDRRPFGTWETTVVLALGVASVGTAVAFLGHAPDVLSVRVFSAAPFFGAVTLLIRWVVVSNRRHSNKRAAVLQALPGSPPHPLATRFAGMWRHPHYPPTVEEIARTSQESESWPEQALIVCLGTLPMLDPCDLRFEPEIIPTTRFLVRRLKITLPVVAMWILFGLGMRWASKGRFSMPVLIYPVAMLVADAMVWAWRGGIRPAYIRIAPGIVQILMYTRFAKEGQGFAAIL